MWGVNIFGPDLFGLVLDCFYSERSYIVTKYVLGGIYSVNSDREIFPQVRGSILFLWLFSLFVCNFVPNRTLNYFTNSKVVLFMMTWVLSNSNTLLFRGE